MTFFRVRLEFTFGKWAIYTYIFFKTNSLISMHNKTRWKLLKIHQSPVCQNMFTLNEQDLIFFFRYKNNEYETRLISFIHIITHCYINQWNGMKIILFFLSFFGWPLLIFYITTNSYYLQSSDMRTRDEPFIGTLHYRQ